MGYAQQGMFDGLRASTIQRWIEPGKSCWAEATLGRVADGKAFETAKCTNKKLLDSSGNEEVLDKKQRTLVAMGKVGMPVNGETARNVILGIIRALKPEMLATPSGTNPNAPKFSLQVVRRFLRVDMDWSVRAGI
jgi:hypothetical protein